MATKPKPAKASRTDSAASKTTGPLGGLNAGVVAGVNTTPTSKPTPVTPKSSVPTMPASMLPTATPTGGRTDAAAGAASRAALNKLTGGQVLTEAERALLNLGPVGVGTGAGTGSGTGSGTGTAWTKAGTVQTLNGPVDVDANGFAQDGSLPIAVSSGGNAGNTPPAPSEKYAGLTALLSSYGIDGIANMVDKVISDFPEADGDEILNLLRYDQRYNKPYMERFAGNAARMKNKMPLLSESDYLRQEQGYSKVFKAYGLVNLDNRTQYTKLISADLDIDEVTERVSLAYDRVLKAEPATKNAFTRFFPMLSNQDLVSAMLDPDEQLPALTRKVQSAEIGGAALRQGLSAELMDTTTTSSMYKNVQAGTIGAGTLETAGVSPATSVVKYEKIASELPTMEKLSSIYGSTLDQYGQREAEQAELLGLASAKRKKERLISREEASFQGSAGTARGSLGATRQGQF